MLKVKKPKPNKLVKIAREFVHGIDMEKKFKVASSGRGAKAKDSDYKKGKVESQQQKARDLADAKAASLDAKGKDRNSLKSLVPIFNLEHLSPCIMISLGRKFHHGS